MRLIHGTRLWLVVGLLCLCVLFYYGTNKDGTETKHQSVLNKGTDLVSMVRPDSVGETPHKDVPPVKKDSWFLDPDDADLIEAGSAADQAPVNIGEYLDPDADPIKEGKIKSSHQMNVGMFLDVEGEPSAQTSHGVLPQRDVGRYIDVDGEDVDSNIGISNEQKEVNIGEFIDVDL